MKSLHCLLLLIHQKSLLIFEKKDPSHDFVEERIC